METEAPQINQTIRWVKDFVIPLNLCPFAKSVFISEKIRFVLCQSEEPEELIQALFLEIERLEIEADKIETTFIIHPNVLRNFREYLDFLTVAEHQLEVESKEEAFQIASFHPHYQFAGTLPDSVENFTNRSPYPMLHLLRGDAVEQAIQSLNDPAEIYQNNIALLEKLGPTAIKNKLLTIGLDFFDR